MTPEEIASNKRKQEQLQNTQRIPDKFDMSGIIEYLHKFSGRIPNESECMRFHMFLNSFAGKPNQKECEDFLNLLGLVRK